MSEVESAVKETAERLKSSFLFEVVRANTNPHVHDSVIRHVMAAVLVLLRTAAGDLQVRTDMANTVTREGQREMDDHGIPFDPDWLDVAKWLHYFIDIPDDQIPDIEYIREQA